MFTGIVKEIGTVAGVERGAAGSRISIRATVADELGRGDSVSVEGVCLTATEVRSDGFDADVMNQTLRVTTLGGLERGARVNLEPALRAGEPLGGHIVQGHVDVVGEIASVSEDGFARRLRVGIPDGLERYLVEHGSIAIAGVSLTVAGLGDGVRGLADPGDARAHDLGCGREGDRVNLELDVVARYVERLLGFKPEGSN